jgi:hypothetical protein
MYLRARNARFSLCWRAAQQPTKRVRAMTHRMYGALVASVGIVALMLAATETFAASRAASGARSHSMSHRSVAQSLRHRRGNGRNDGGVFWPDDGFYDDSSNGGPVADVPQSTSGDVHYTYKKDVPWDWAHRFPPAVAPSDRPYVQSCAAENVTVPGHGGQQQTVNITRCY